VFILAHLLGFFGASIGRSPHFVVGATKHRLNLFIGLIGPSGLSRKGSAGDVAQEIWRRVNPGFAENIIDGLNTGAGLLYELRDGGTKPGKTGHAIVDDGVPDKRRVFLEPELSSLLKQGHRENDPLTEYLRKFFDGNECVRSKAKGDPLKVTGGHVAIVGHCTPADLEVHLTDADKSNGTANRFLWLFGIRARFLPDGGNIFSLLDFLGSRLQDLELSLDFARGINEIRRSPEIEDRWKLLYRSFDDIPPGKLGMFHVRAAPFVMRIASIYALADRSSIIKSPHLEAAVAIWEHSVRSLRFIFDADCDPVAEKLLAAFKVHPDGLTRREILHDVFGRNKDAKSVDTLLARLLAYKRIERTDPVSRGGSKGGRPAPLYRIYRW
jgi:hypothetical protein